MFSSNPLFRNLKWSNSNWTTYDNKYGNKNYKIITEIEEMTWTDKIKNWENGIPQKYPKKIINDKKSTIGFMWKTTPCDKDMKNIYKEKFIIDNFPNTENHSSYDEYIKKSENKNVTCCFHKVKIY